MMFDRMMGRLLFVNVPMQAVPADVSSTDRAERTFGVSLMISAVRCILQYVILPFVLPVIGVASEAAVPISLTINVIAVGLIFYSLRRFWTIRYERRWQYLPVALAAFVILGVFIAMDIRALLAL
jgi:hypothetical protein